MFRAYLEDSRLKDADTFDVPADIGLDCLRCDLDCLICAISGLDCLVCAMPGLDCRDDVGATGLMQVPPVLDVPRLPRGLAAQGC